MYKKSRNIDDKLTELSLRSMKSEYDYKEKKKFVDILG